MTGTSARPVAVLIGPPGSGKSTVARLLADRLGVTVRDTDADVETVAGKTISDVFVEDGEPRFRELEREAVARALAEHDGVLALGGGAVLDEETQRLLEAHTAAGGSVVFLDVSLTHAAPRVGFNTSRPLLLGNPRAQWQGLMNARRPVYERLATLHVSTDGLRPGQVADRIAESLGDPAASPADEGETASGTGPGEAQA